jgi:hypothetical protein
VTAFQPTRRAPRLDNLTAAELDIQRLVARELAGALCHELGRFTPARLINGHPITVAMCVRIGCTMTTTVVLNPGDGSDPVTGKATTLMCKGDGHGSTGGRAGPG